MPKITFLPAGVTIEVHEGVTVFNAAARAEVAIPSQCGGKCACALCRVELVEGSELISPMSWEEESHLGNSFHLTRERLSCQTQVFGNVVVRIKDLPVREKARGRFIPRALIRKREKMEREEELRRVRGDANAAGRRPVASGGGPVASGGGPGADVAVAEERPGPPAARKGFKKRRSGTRGRNPGAPRSGDSRPPPGLKKKD